MNSVSARRSIGLFAWITLLAGLAGLLLAPARSYAADAGAKPVAQATSPRIAPHAAPDLAPAAVLVALHNTDSSTPSTQSVHPEAVVIGLAGEIDDYNRDQFIRRIAKARALGAKTIIIDINTYGGLVTSGLDLSSFIKSLNDLHTIAFVNANAVSAGAMIAMSCDEIVMSDSAVIGDCAPISIRPDDSIQPIPDAERGKVESPILADFYDSAIRNHHDPLLAKAMVSVATVVHWMQSPTGERRFVDEATFNTLTKENWKPVADAPDPLDGAKTLLTLHTNLAVRTGLATGQASSIQALAAQRHLTIIKDLKPEAGEIALEFLSDGLVRMLLIIVFAISLYIILHAPGHGLAEAVGLISLGLLLGAPLLTGYATWWELVMIFVGLGLVAFEIFVLPHTGIMVLVGLISMVAGLLMTFVGMEPAGEPGVLPQLQGTWTSLQHGVFYMVAALACSGVLMVWISRYLPKLPFLNRLILTATSGGSTASPRASSLAGLLAAKPEPLGGATASSWLRVGALGRSVTELKPGGSAEFYDEVRADSRVASVVSESGFIKAGVPIIVRGVDGSSVRVRAV